MPILSNARHERFAQELAKGKSQIEAYEIAGYKPDEPNASRLTSNDKVQARVAEILGRAAERTVLTKQWVIERLVQNVDRALQAQEVMRGDEGTGEYRYDGAVANRALELLGKELGMFVDRREIGDPGDFDRLTEQELEAKILERARQLNIPIGAGDSTQH